MARYEAAQFGAKPAGARPQADEHESARAVRQRHPWFAEPAEHRHPTRPISDADDDLAAPRPARATTPRAGGGRGAVSRSPLSTSGNVSRGNGMGHLDEPALRQPADRVRPVLGPQGNVVQHMAALPHREVARTVATVRASGANATHSVSPVPEPTHPLRTLSARPVRR